jgi:hypothetical protein
MIPFVVLEMTFPSASKRRGRPPSRVARRSDALRRRALERRPSAHRSKPLRPRPGAESAVYEHDRHGLGGNEAAALAILDRQLEAVETGENRALAADLDRALGGDDRTRSHKWYDQGRGGVAGKVF